MIKTTWILSDEDSEVFGWTFLDGFDVLKLYPHRLPAKAAKVRRSHFWKKCVCRGITLEGKNISQFKTFKGE